MEKEFEPLNMGINKKKEFMSLSEKIGIERLEKKYHKELEIKKFLSDSKRKEFFIIKGKLEVVEDIKEFIKIILEKDEELMKEVKDFVFEHKPRNQDCKWDFTNCAEFVLEEYDKRLRAKIKKRAGPKLTK